MDNSAPISEEVKNKAYRDITDIVLAALDKNVLSAEDAEDISIFVLNRIDSLTSQEMFDAFLEEMAQRWHCFKPLLFSKEERVTSEHDQQDIAKIQQQISQLTQ